MVPQDLQVHQFLFPIRIIAETEFSTHIFNQYLSNVNGLFEDSLRFELTTVLHGKNIIFFETFIWPFLRKIMH